MDQLHQEDEDRARRKEKKCKEKDRRAQSRDPAPAQPTVSLLDYQPPSESSSNEAEIAKKLDFEGEVKSEKVEVLEPTTPEQLLAQPSADQGYDPGPPPMEVDAPERVEGQDGTDDQGEQEPEKPPPDGDKPEESGEQGSGEAQDSSGPPPRSSRSARTF